MSWGKRGVTFLIGSVVITGLYYGVNIARNYQKEKINVDTETNDASKPLNIQKADQANLGRSSQFEASAHPDATKTYREVFRETFPQKSETERITEREMIRKLDKSTEEIIQKADERIQDRHLIVPNNPVSPEKTQELNKKIEKLQKNLDQQQ